MASSSGKFTNPNLQPRSISRASSSDYSDISAAAAAPGGAISAAGSYQDQDHHQHDHHHIPQSRDHSRSRSSTGDDHHPIAPPLPPPRSASDSVDRSGDRYGEMMYSTESSPLPGNLGPGSVMRSPSDRFSSINGSDFGGHDQIPGSGPWFHGTKSSYDGGSGFLPDDPSPWNHSINPDDDVSGPLMLHSRPLARKVPISWIILSLYRFLAAVRLVALALFLAWRVSNPNGDAMWLWGMSVVCELWFSFSWLLDQLPKLSPMNREVDLDALRERFEGGPVIGRGPGVNAAAAAGGRSDLPGMDVFVSTADPEKEPPLVTANTILSILAAEYPVEKLACYVSDDGGALLTFEAMAEAASFARRVWVPFCRKHGVEPRSPEAYFGQPRDPTRGRVRQDFVRDRRRARREYDELKVRINALPGAIRRRSDAFDAHEEVEARKRAAPRSDGGELAPHDIRRLPKATWMSDGTHWPGTWIVPCREHTKGDHAGIVQVILSPPSCDPVYGEADEGGGDEDDGGGRVDATGIDVRLPMLVYISREKRPGYEHNKKAGAMNALVRASAVMSNGPFVLNLDCDHYVHNPLALRAGVCFMLDAAEGQEVCYVQFPQRFDGIDPSDRYANHNTVFFDGNMRALDGLQGPMYVGTGCMFRRVALYGFEPPPSRFDSRLSDCCSSSWLFCCCCCCCCCRRRRYHHNMKAAASSKKVELATASSLNDTGPIGLQSPDRDDQLAVYNNNEEDQPLLLRQRLVPKAFGGSGVLLDSIPIAELGGRPVSDLASAGYCRPPGMLASAARRPLVLDPSTLAEALFVVSCWYEDKTEWGSRLGWIYGSVTEDVVTGYRMHCRGWRSVYCLTRPDAFRGTAPINLTDRLQQVLRWATGSVEIFFSRNNAALAGPRMQLLQRIAYLNVGMYPFTSVFLVVYCTLPALSLLADEFIVQALDVYFLAYLLAIAAALCGLAVLETRWAGITLEEWWRNEQFWVIGGTSAHIVAVLQGVLKVVAGVDISFTLTSKATAGPGPGDGDGDGDGDPYAELYVVKWTALLILPLVIMMLNLVAVAVATARTVYSANPSWSKFLGGVFFSFWVLAHLYPFAKGLMGRRRRTPTIVFVWAGLISISIALLWATLTNVYAPTSTSVFTLR